MRVLYPSFSEELPPASACTKVHLRFPSSIWSLEAGSSRNSASLTKALRCLPPPSARPCTMGLACSCRSKQQSPCLAAREAKKYLFSSSSVIWRHAALLLYCSYKGVRWAPVFSFHSSSRTKAWSRVISIRRLLP